MSKREITVQELLALMPSAEFVELQVAGVDVTTGYASELKELCETPYIVKNLYSYYSSELEDSYTVIVVDI